MTTFLRKTAKVFFITAMVMTMSFSTAPNDGVEWMEWGKAYSKAKKKKKKILLIDAYTDWCGWCKKMDKDTYADASIIGKIEKNFLPVKFNPEKKGMYKVDGEELSGRQLLSKLANGGRVGYPTTFFLDVADNKVKKISGYRNAQDFGQLLDEVVAWSKED